jgi:hypothetical protein
MRPHYNMLQYSHTHKKTRSHASRYLDRNLKRRPPEFKIRNYTARAVLLCQNILVYFMRNCIKVRYHQVVTQIFISSFRNF